MTNYLNLGEPTDIYNEITYTPTEFSATSNNFNENSIRAYLNTSRDILKTRINNFPGFPSKPSFTTSATTLELPPGPDYIAPVPDYTNAFKINNAFKSNRPSTANTVSTDTSDTVPSNNTVKEMKRTNPTGTIYKSRDEFKNTLYNAYLKTLKKYNFDPEFAKYLTAQDALESGWGKSSLSAYNNFGGIKASKDNVPYVERKTKEHDKATDTYKEIIAKFRAFDSLEDYCDYKIKLLNNSNYKVFSRKPEEFADSLTTYAKYKYATAPDYKEKILSVFRSM